MSRSRGLVRKVQCNTREDFDKKMESHEDFGMVIVSVIVIS